MPYFTFSADAQNNGTHMSYAFDKDAKDGDVVTLENGVAYQYDAAKDRWLVKAVGWWLWRGLGLPSA